MPHLVECHIFDMSRNTLRTSKLLSNDLLISCVVDTSWSMLESQI